MHRFHVPDLDPTQAIVALPADEARHLARVLRLGAGAVVLVFDGAGRQFTARVRTVDRRGASVELIEPCAAAAEARVAVTLAPAVLKGPRMDDVVRDAVMLGVAEIRPVLSERVDAPAGALGARPGRWQRVAVASAKQCGRAVVPAVRPAVPLARLLTDPGPGTMRLALVEPAQPGGRSVASVAPAPPAAACVLAGPEGGWTPAEVDRIAAAGFCLVTLGSRTLRADAVPVAALAVLQAVWGDL